MSYETIKEHLADMYGLDISPAKISLITDKLMPDITEWRNTEEYISIENCILMHGLTEYYYKYRAASYLFQKEESFQFHMYSFNLSPFIRNLPFYDRMLMMDYFLNQAHQAMYCFLSDDHPLRIYCERYPVTPSSSKHAEVIIQAYTKDYKMGIMSQNDSWVLGF